jgi:hypothetical protein
VGAEIAFSNLFKNYKLQGNFQSYVFLQQLPINVDKPGKPGQGTCPFSGHLLARCQAFSSKVKSGR